MTELKFDLKIHNFISRLSIKLEYIKGIELTIFHI